MIEYIPHPTMAALGILAWIIFGALLGLAIGPYLDSCSRSTEGDLEWDDE